MNFRKILESHQKFGNDVKISDISAKFREYYTAMLLYRCIHVFDIQKLLITDQRTISHVFEHMWDALAKKSHSQLFLINSSVSWNTTTITIGNWNDDSLVHTS